MPNNRWIPVANLHTSAEGTNLVEYLPGSNGYYTNEGFTELFVKVRRTAETGTCTLDVGIQWFDPVASQFHALLDMAGNAVGIVQYADAAVDTTGYRSLRIGRGSAGGADADGVITYGTNYRAYDIVVPQFFRFVVTNGGTTVTNTYSITAFLLN